MPGAAIHHSLKVRPPKPLVVRAGLSRTFGSLAGFLALLFLSMGIYLLADAFAHPVDAEAVALIVAAFAIALSALLFFYLFKPQRFGGRRLRSTCEDSPPSESGDFSTSACSACAGKQDARKDLVIQQSHVDRSKVSR